jgi:hypothetical protein
MALEQLPQLTSQKSLVERIKYQISVGAPFIILKGGLGAGKTVICEQLISAVDDKFIKAYIPGAGNHDLTKCREILLNQISKTNKINSNDKLIGTVQKINFNGKRVLIVIDDFDNVADRFISELADIYSTYAKEQIFSIVATVSSSSKLSQKVRQLNSLNIEPMEMQIKPISMQESILVMHYYGSQVGMRGLDDRSLKNSRELQAAKGNPGAIKSMIEGISDVDCNKYNPIERAKRRKKAVLTALFGGAAVAATVAGILVYVIKNQNKPLVNDEYAYEHNTSVREMQSLIENDDRNVDSLAPELSRPREDLNPFVIVEEKGSVSSKSEGSSANISKNEDSASPEKKIVISDEDSADIVTGATAKSSGLNNTGETVDKLRAEANIEAKAKDIAENNARHENLIKAEEKLKVEADAKAKLEAEKKAAEEKAKAEAEAKAKLEAAKKAAEEKAKAEAEAKAKLEAAKKAAEEKAKAEAEAKVKLEAAKKAAEEKAKAEAEAKEKLEAEKKAAEAKAKAEAEAKAKLEAEKKAAEEKAEAEAKAKLEVAKKAAEEKAKAEAEAKAKLEAAKKAAEEKAKAEAEAKAKLEAAKKAVEEKAKAEAEAKAKLEAEKKAAEAKAKAEAEAKAKLDAAKKAAEEKARADAQHKKQEERNSQSVTGDNKQLPFEELNDSHYTVQLVATSKKDEAQRVARKVGNSWVLFRKKDQQYIVMYGDFKDRSSATQSISGLPEAIRKTKPWAKNIAAVKKEIQ